MRPVIRILVTQIGCSAGIQKMCLMYKVLSSTTSQISMSWVMSTNLMKLEMGSNHLTGPCTS